MVLLAVALGVVEMQPQCSQTLLHCISILEMIFNAFFNRNTLCSKRITKLSTVGSINALLPPLVSNTPGPSGLHFMEESAKYKI